MCNLVRPYGFCFWYFRVGHVEFLIESIVLFKRFVYMCVNV
jgi:hypothetical protein